MLFSELIEKYKKSIDVKYKKNPNSNNNTIKGYDYDLRQFCLYMRNPHIEFIKESDVIEYLGSMLTLGWKPNGIMPKSIALRNVFKYANRLGLQVISHELIPIPHREYAIPRVADDYSIGKLLEECPKGTNNLQHVRNRCIITFLKSTGCRNGEMCSIDLPQLLEHFEERRVIIKTAKSRGVRPIRELFWDEEAHNDLKSWIKARESLKKKMVLKDPDALFVGVKGWQTGKRITNSGISIMFRRLSFKAGIPVVNAHSLRHYRGHEMNNLAANNSTISGILGHASVVSSFIYTQMNSKELKAAAQKYRKS